MNILLSYLASAVIGGVVTLFFQWLFHKYQQREKQERIKPEVRISSVFINDLPLVEIHNIGSEDIEELKANITWMQEGTRQPRTLINFFAPKDDPYLTTPEKKSFLRIQETIRGADIPMRSDDGIIHIIVEGMGSISRKSLKYTSSINVEKCH